MLKLILDPCDWRLGMFSQCPAPSSLFVSLLYLAQFMIWYIKENIHISKSTIYIYIYIIMIREELSIYDCWYWVAGISGKKLSSFLAALEAFHYIYCGTKGPLYVHVKSVQ